MPIAVTEEQVALGGAVRAWAEAAGVRAGARTAGPGRPPWWEGLRALGAVGIALPERHGGGGGSAVDLAVVVEELGYAVAPGPYVPSAAAGLALGAAEPSPAVAEVLGALAAGTADAAVATGGWLALRPDGTVCGDAGPVLGAVEAAWLVAVADNGRCVLVPLRGGDGRGDGRDSGGDGRDGRGDGGGDGPDGRGDGRDGGCDGGRGGGRGPGCAVEAVDGVDVTRPVGRVRLDGAAATELPGLDAGLLRACLGTVLAAEAAGVARWCVDTAVGYAQVREQFGRRIGEFQAVKHLCADMLAHSATAAAAAWDAAAAYGAGPFVAAADVAVAAALPAAVAAAQTCIQVLGGIGYTWEHDAHLALRRALASRALTGGTAAARARVTAAARAGTRRRPPVDLTALTEADAGELRARVRETVARAGAGPDRRRVLADAGLLAPHWPAPYGLGAGALEQLVIAEELAGVDVPDLVIGNWAVPTILAHGSDAQRERFARPTLYGEIRWCQLFSEPDAGSDLAALRTRAERTEGGWLLTGQKVWTSSAREADWAICLARTDPDAPAHRGITYFLVDMRSPGITVRPLRELTGEALFNEVFLDGVPVPDDCVVGAPGAGWRIARATLANERVAMSTSPLIGTGLAELLAAAQPEPVLDDRAGALLAGLSAAAALGTQTALRQAGGLDPGAAASVRKLVGMHLTQDARALAVEVVGAAVLTGEGAEVLRAYLSSRALTIAGGTSQVLRNVVAERVLGLPRG